MQQTRQSRDQLDEERTDLERDAIIVIADECAEHAAEYSRREAFYQVCLMEEVDRHTSLTSEIVELKASNSLTRTRTLEVTSCDISRAEGAAAAQLATADAAIALIEVHSATMARETAEMMEQTLEDAEDEGKALRVPYHNAIRAERDAANRFKSEILMLKKRISNAAAAIDGNKAEIKNRISKQGTAVAQVQASERDLAALKGVIREREGTMVEKDKKIGERGDETQTSTPHACL